jgi:hypothetical protein
MRRRWVLWLVLAGAGLAAVGGAGVWVWHTCATPIPPADESIINITCPYEATPERARQIRDGYHRVRLGASVAEVTTVLGDPDEVHPRYEPFIYRPRRIGTVDLYYLAKPDDRSENMRGVRVSFDLDGRVSKVDHWGFD